MRLKRGLLGGAVFISLLAIGSQPQPAAAFACSRAVGCTNGCRTELDASGDYEGVHVCYSACTYPDCIQTLAMTPEVNTLVQNTTSGDIKAAVKLATKYRVSVRYNADRHALMYYAACTGDIPIGVQPLSPDQSQAVAAAIAD